MLEKNIYNDESLWQASWEELVSNKKNVNICERCVLDDEIPGVVISKDSKICNYCTLQDMLEKRYPGGEKGFQDLKKLASIIKKSSTGSYDVAIGVSGGCDSSYMMHLAVNELGLKPLAVHFDNSWNTNIATENIRKITKKLNIDLYTHVVNNKEFDDIFLSHLKSGVQDIENPTDLALAATMREACDKHKIKYIFDGHSFRTEGVSPAGSLYMDAKYLKDVHSKYGSKKITSLPQLTLFKQLKWMMFNKINVIRPLWYIDYNKEFAKKALKEKYDWHWYGGHHLENQTAAFYHTFFCPRRLKLDTRTNGFSGLIRSGQMTRQDALNQMNEAPYCDLEIIQRVKKRLGISEESFLNFMQQPVKTYKDFRSYKKIFEILRPFFYIMAKLNRIPWSFYEKYTIKHD